MPRRDKKEKSNAESLQQLENSLSQAQATVERSQASIARLHYEWRSHLQRIGVMIIFISFYQMYTPAKTCYEELNEWNGLSNTPIALVILADSVVFLLGSLVAILLVRFTRSHHHNLKDLNYMLASAIVPVLLGLWFLQKQQPTYEGVPDCLATSLLYQPNGTAKGTVRRNLPIVLVFHVIVSASYFFMSHQRAKQSRNLEAIVQLRQELELSKKKR
ncbi:hypothetical protein FisN_27Lh053 [Fistulifera solaris]|uniref:Uncharacterized protein n=1 Tax=Fistulifera solaris TaxID=1519565 RepID=A0A1Z5JHT1_FISSO|nr:hypothetical protein FisN_27Lh053 [Fistulifera solaris]|eukprot:GAX13554.1 hypothetical protein FisN_27Lh053 [Fistulifera solaris]